MWQSVLSLPVVRAYVFFAVVLQGSRLRIPPAIPGESHATKAKVFVVSDRIGRLAKVRVRRARFACTPGGPALSLRRFEFLPIHRSAWQTRFLLSAEMRLQSKTSGCSFSSPSSARTTAPR